MVEQQLPPPKIRLRYAGLTNFVARALSLLTGLAFTVIVTRRLPIEDFGVWAYASFMIQCFLTPAAIPCYWMRRALPRGEPALRPALVLNTVFMLAVTPVFLLLSRVSAAKFGVPMRIFMLLLIQLYAVYLFYLLEQSTASLVPHALGYALTIFELAKLGAALLLVWRLDLGLPGAILSLIIAYATADAYMALVLSPWFTGWSSAFLRRCARLFWIPLLAMASRMLWTGDRAVLGFATGSTEPIAYYGVGVSLSSIVILSSSVAVALYPSLLRSPRPEFVEEILRLTSLIALPVAAAILAHAKLLLAIYKPAYVAGAPVARLLALAGLAQCLYEILRSVALGIERVDEHEADLAEYFRSLLVRTPLLVCVHAALYLVSLALLAGNIEDPISAAMLAAALSLVFWSSLDACLLIMVRRRLRFRLPWRFALKCALSAVAASCASMLVPTARREVPSSLLMVIARLIPVGLVFVLVYAGILLLADSYARRLCSRLLERLGLRFPMSRIRLLGRCDDASQSRGGDPS